MTVRLGVSFDGFVTTREAIALAERAVGAGAKSLWVAEHLGYREAIATCMAFALKAPGPMLVPTAVSPYLWHPMPTAMAMATLDEIAPGRAATGWRAAIEAPSDCTIVRYQLRSRGALVLDSTRWGWPRPLLDHALADRDFDVRYYAVSGLASATHEGEWPAADIFRENEGHYISFWMSRKARLQKIYP